LDDGKGYGEWISKPQVDETDDQATSEEPRSAAAAGGSFKGRRLPLVHR